MRPIVAITILLLMVLSAVGQDAPAPRDERVLLLAMTDDSATDGGSDPAARRQHLVALRFRDGVLAATDTIVTNRGERKTFTSRQSRLYRDRYVVCDNGDIVDLQEREYLFRVGWYDPTYTRFTEFDGDLVRMRQPSTEVVITVDLVTGAVTREVVSPAEPAPATDTPSETRSQGNLRDVGHGFTIERAGRRLPRQITHRGEPVGIERFALDDCRTGPGVLALIPRRMADRVKSWPSGFPTTEAGRAFVSRRAGRWPRKL